VAAAETVERFQSAFDADTDEDLGPEPANV
jgi:hypothetical protein